MASQIPVIDLFAGAGGFASASLMAGCDVRLSVEIDKVCCDTLHANNLGKMHVVENADVREIRGAKMRTLAKVSKSDPLIVVGGPPCQPFSKASYWTDPGHDSKYRRARAKGVLAERPDPITIAKDDERRDLLGEFYRLVLESKSDGFVMENVRSLLHPRNKKMLNDLLTAFHKAKYHCTFVDADASAYGVPQKRQRIFILGSRRVAPIAPSPTYRTSSKGPSNLPDALGVGQFIKEFSSKKFFEEGELVEGRWADLLKEIPPGWNYKYHTEWAGHPNPVFEAETRFWNFLLKLDPASPSWTINANPGPWVGPFHWESRRLRTPELAAIQTFPKGYIFTGSRRDRIRQIGNAVPPVLASKMIKSVMDSLG